MLRVLRLVLKMSRRFRVILGDASGNTSPPHRISELDCELPNRSLLDGENFNARVAVDQGNRSSQTAG